MLDLAPIVAWAAAIATLGGAGGLIWKLFWAGSGSKANGEKLDKLALTVGNLSDRMKTLEDEFKHIPDAKSFHAIELAMKGMSGKMDVIEERLKPIAGIAERLQEVLLNRGDR